MKILIGLLVLVVLLVGVVLALPFFIDLNKYQDQYKPLIEDALNRKVQLQDIRLTVWPRIGARVAGVAELETSLPVVLIPMRVVVPADLASGGFCSQLAAAMSTSEKPATCAPSGPPRGRATTASGSRSRTAGESRCRSASRSPLRASRRDCARTRCRSRRASTGGSP